ncbi:uncharacterized protein A4U43_C03F23850 [Asparagus officinalis]|uniref:Uncharacterized protein n=1 Tax=Asparagus officinalis TaxID=4686 RepID=A0A5P1FCK4_ASPOF|nr:uncharacterized protein A4U43_C03F23850 [Asparagus officinalis]
MLIGDQQVLAKSSEPIVSEGMTEVAIAIFTVEEEEGEEEVDYSGGSDTIVDDVFRDYDAGGFLVWLPLALVLKPALPY